MSKAKHVIETIDGSKVLKKLADNRGPKFNRSRVYITAPLKTGYGYHFPVDVSVRDARSGMVLYTRCLSTIHLMHLSKLALRRMLMGLEVCRRLVSLRCGWFM